MEPSGPTISPEYLEQQQALHRDPNYGVASIQFAPLVKQVIEEFGVRSLSDYGAGKQNLRRRLEALGVALDYRPYDPAFPEYGPARSADLVCCIDVLEHIEPAFLDTVLDELKAITTAHGMFTVHTSPAERVLPDGRNAHLIVEDSAWWLERLQARFKVERIKRWDLGFAVLVSPR